MKLISLSRMITGGKVVVGMWLSIWILTFAMGSVAGGSAALNESESVHGIHANLTEAEQELNRDLEANLTDSEQMLLLPQRHIINTAWGVAHVGVSYGYQNPSHVKLIGEASPLLAVVAVFAPLQKELRQIYRRLRQ